MSRYIDAEHLQSVLRKKAEQELNKTTAPFSWSFAYECFAESIDTFPTADVAPVVHAHWKFIKCYGGYFCSNCGRNKPIFDGNYCEWCGAKMDGELEK